MKLSIFTPTHDAKYLKELEETIIQQTHDDWEWVILLNNGAKYESNDERIKIYYANVNTKGVGALKREACKLCIGDVLVEVDHDDLLTNNCLEELNKVFEAEQDVGFVYSDNAKLSDSFNPYNPKYGWTYRKFNYNGKELIAMNSFEPTPYRMSYIWFQPDHVRAWRKSTYWEVGGHDETLEVCDDQDLMIRTYLQSKFYHIPEVLYIYRIIEGGDNTWIKRNQEIQTLTVELHNKYIYQLAKRFSELNGLKMIDLCGGFGKPEGYISIDKYNGDIIADLELGIPLPDNSVGVVRAHDALEHIKNSQHLMNEIHRVLAPGGILLSMTPSTDGRGAFQDPTHISFWNQNSFFYYTRPQQAQYIHQTNLFWEAKLTTVFPTKYHENNNIPYVIARLEVRK
jgi:glycosyltransferase involved in cell wall biosynthesis